MTSSSRDAAAPSNVRERALIAVGQFDESVDPALTKEARAIFDSIEFLGPDE